MKALLRRCKYRYYNWFYGRPDWLERSVAVENVLLKHYKAKTSPTPDECFQLAMKLGVPSQLQR